MTYQCSVILRKIRKLTQNTDKLFYLDYYKDKIHLRNKDAFIDCSKYKGEIKPILDELENLKLIEKKSSSYVLTHHGMHPLQISVDQAIHFAFTSIAVPIGVSFITSLIYNILLMCH